MLERFVRPAARRWPVALALSAAPLAAWPQATVKNDGQWRYAFGAGASRSSGNSNVASLNITGEAVRATGVDKLLFAGRGVYARTEGITTTENTQLGTQYNRDLSSEWFAFGRADALRDRPANIASRFSVHGGPGWHLIRGERLSWDISAGVGYTQDRYITPAEVGGAMRSEYGHTELVLAEESTHKWWDSTDFRQKLQFFPNLKKSGEYRAAFDANIAVAMNAALSLTAGLSYRYDSDPGVGHGPRDLLFVTGVSVKLD
jgi:putative salt-induced outer membrane protein